jgi:hypothetical protein
VSMLCVDTKLHSTQLLALTTFRMMQAQTASLQMEQAQIKVRAALVLNLLVPGRKPGLGLGRITVQELVQERTMQEVGLELMPVLPLVPGAVKDLQLEVGSSGTCLALIL